MMTMCTRFRSNPCKTYVEVIHSANAQVAVSADVCQRASNSVD